MSEEKNSDSESKEEQPKEERKFNPELLKKGLQCDLKQYNRLIACSKNGPKGIEEWNQWRKENRSEKIWLEGADLEHTSLEGANLNSTNMQGAKLNVANLQGAELREANLQGAEFYIAKLQGADLWKAELQGALFQGIIVDGATNFLHCEIDKNTDFREMALENVRIEFS